MGQDVGFTVGYNLGRILWFVLRTCITGFVYGVMVRIVLVIWPL